MSSQSFADLGVSRAVVRALDARGITEPFAIQNLVVADVLAGRDVLAQSPTGSGKTLAFGAPMMDRVESDGPRPAALILAPTRELVSQIVEELRPIAHARALKIASVYGGVGLVKQAKEAARAQIIVATPGRLEDLLDRRSFALSKVNLLVLDEADRMLDMGFKPAVDRIVAQCPKQRQTLFFSATLEGEAGRVAHAYTRSDAVSHSHAPDQKRLEAVEHRFHALEREEKLDALVRELRSAERDLALVFVRTKRGADRLVKRLGREGVDAVAMHGDKSQSQREKALARFESGRVSTLVATDVAARGIDVSGISHVINFDPPEDQDAYTHRIGRTARAGRTGVGITFFGSEDGIDVEKIAAKLKLHREFAESGFVTPRGGGGGGSRPKQRSGGGSRNGGGGGSRPRFERDGGPRGGGGGSRKNRSRNGSSNGGSSRNGNSSKRNGSTNGGGRTSGAVVASAGGGRRRRGR
jgi:ATP-dependent RNA helicase RhlE